MIRISRIGKKSKHNKGVHQKSEGGDTSIAGDHAPLLISGEVVRLEPAKPPPFRKGICFKRDPHPIKGKATMSAKTKNPPDCVAVFGRFPDMRPINRLLKMKDVIEVSGVVTKSKSLETKYTILLLDMDHSTVAILGKGVNITKVWQNSRDHTIPDPIDVGEVDYVLKIKEGRLPCPWWTRWFLQLFNRDLSWQKTRVEKLHTGETRFVVYLEKLLDGAAPEEEPSLCPSFFAIDSSPTSKVAS
jgi:hypothetical protein